MWVSAVRRLGALALWADCGHRSQAGLLMGMNHSPSVSLNTAWPALHIITLLPSSPSHFPSLTLSLFPHTYFKIRPFLEYTVYRRMDL